MYDAGQPRTETDRRAGSRTDNRTDREQTAQTRAERKAEYTVRMIMKRGKKNDRGM